MTITSWKLPDEGLSGEDLAFANAFLRGRIERLACLQDIMHQYYLEPIAAALAKDEAPRIPTGLFLLPDALEDAAQQGILDWQKELEGRMNEAFGEYVARAGQAIVNEPFPGVLGVMCPFFRPSPEDLESCFNLVNKRLPRER